MRAKITVYGLLVVVSLAIILGGAAVTIAGTLSDEKVINTTNSFLKNITNVSFEVQVITSEEKKNLRIAMVPDGFKFQSGDLLGKIAGLAIILGSLAADEGDGFDAVQVEVKGIAEFQLAVRDFRIMKTTRLTPLEIMQKVKFTPR